MVDPGYAQVAPNRRRKVGGKAGGVKPVALSKVIGCRILLKQVEDQRVGAYSARVQRLWVDCLDGAACIPETQQPGLQAVQRHDSSGCRGAYVATPFILQEEESLLLEYRAPHGGPK